WEVRYGVPFVGESGKILNESLMHYGVSREEVYVTNILDEPIPLGTSVYDQPNAVLDAGLARLTHELATVRPNCILLCGNDPLQAVAGKEGITKWRGSILESTLVPGIKCVAAMHAANFIRGQWKWLPVFKYIDVKRFVEEARTPLISLPRRDAITGPSFSMV